MEKKERKKKKPIIPKSKKAKHYNDTYYKKVALKKIKEMEEFPISVLLCGPGENTDLALFKKRLDIKAALHKRCINGFLGEEFVEDIKQTLLQNHSETHPMNIYELIAAQTADLITIFYEGDGAKTETNEFLNVKSCAFKTYVWKNRKYGEDGYSSQGIFNLYPERVIPFSDNDITSCNLLTQVIEKAVRCRDQKWYEKQRGIK
jgi:hypothetical protein